MSGKERNTNKATDSIRLIAMLPFIPFMFIGVVILYIFGIPFLVIGGKKAAPIFDAITSLIKD